MESEIGVAFDRKANNCALQHIKTFREQALKENIADFGEPCQSCV